MEDLEFLLVQTAQANKAIANRDSERARTHVSTIFPRLSELILSSEAPVRRPLVVLNKSTKEWWLVHRGENHPPAGWLGVADFPCPSCGMPLPLGEGEVSCSLCKSRMRIEPHGRSVRVHLVVKRRLVNQLRPKNDR